MRIKRKKVTISDDLPGAENETRTRDPNLGKVVLYQLSYFRKFSMFSSKELLSSETCPEEWIAKIGIFSLSPKKISLPAFTSFLSGNFPLAIASAQLPETPGRHPNH